MTVSGASRAAAALLAFVALAAAGCAPAGDELEVTRRQPLSIGAVASLHIDEDGRYWIGGGGGVVIVDSAGGVYPGVTTRGLTPPRVAAQGAGTLYLLHEDTLIAVDVASRERLGARGGFADVVVMTDVRGRFVVQGARSGAVLGFDPRTLEPVWGWAARGAPTTALAAAPQGDMIWQALEDGDGGVILQRDVQTGRVIDLERFADRVTALSATSGGDLIALLGGGARIEAVRLRPRAGELVPIWRTPVRLAGEAAARLVHEPGAPVLAIFRPDSETGLRVLDAEAGAPVGSVARTPVDAALSPEGALHLLYPREVRRVRPRAGY